MIAMHNDTLIREHIEAQLSQALEIGLDIEEALAEVAGLLTEAEARFVRLTHPRLSFPPPVSPAR